MSQANCSTPAPETPIANAWPGVSVQWERPRSEATKHKFKMIGVAAAAARGQRVQLEPLERGAARPPHGRAQLVRRAEVLVGEALLDVAPRDCDTALHQRLSH